MRYVRMKGIYAVCDSIRSAQWCPSICISVFCDMPFPKRWTYVCGMPLCEISRSITLLLAAYKHDGRDCSAMRSILVVRTILDGWECGAWQTLEVAKLLPVLSGRTDLIITLYAYFPFFGKISIFRSSYTTSSIVVACDTRLTGNNITPKPNLCCCKLNIVAWSLHSPKSYCTTSILLKRPPYCLHPVKLFLDFSRSAAPKNNYVAALVLSGMQGSVRGLNRWEYKWLLLSPTSSAKPRRCRENSYAFQVDQWMAEGCIFYFIFWGVFRVEEGIKLIWQVNKNDWGECKPESSTLSLQQHRFGSGDMPFSVMCVSYH